MIIFKDLGSKNLKQALKEQFSFLFNFQLQSFFPTHLYAAFEQHRGVQGELQSVHIFSLLLLPFPNFPLLWCVDSPQHRNLSPAWLLGSAVSCDGTTPAVFLSSCIQYISREAKYQEDKRCWNCYLQVKTFDTVFLSIFLEKGTAHC